MTVLAEEPFHYTIEGSPHRWLIYRTEKIDDRGRLLCLFVPDLPVGDQHPLDVMSMHLDDRRISMAPRKTGVAVSDRGVLVVASVIDRTDTPSGMNGDTEVNVEVFDPNEDRGRSHTRFTTRVSPKGAEE